EGLVRPHCGKAGAGKGRQPGPRHVSSGAGYALGEQSAPEETAVSTPHRAYIPAAGSDLLLPFYDPLNRLLGVGKLHRELIEEARLAPDLRVLDVGCGTGSLAVLLRREHPRVDVVAR